MKTSKKLIILVLALTMLLALTACGGESGSGDSKNDATPADPIAAVAETYGLDLKSTEIQEMTSDRADCATLSSVAHDYLEGNTFFSGTDLENITYADLKNEIGVDASTYNFDDGLMEGNVFIWKAGDNDTASFLAQFCDGKLYATGSANLG